MMYPADAPLELEVAVSPPIVGAARRAAFIAGIELHTDCHSARFNAAGDRVWYAQTWTEPVELEVGRILSLHGFQLTLKAVRKLEVS